jgi:NADH-quinone oxidoreductase subunit G
MQMFGALIKDQLAKTMNIPREKLVMVCVAPCTAKKFEASREEFFVDGNPNVDHVITTEELARMMKEHGIDFSRLELDSFDMPYGFSTGGAVIFGSSGGVSEAVLRFTADTLNKGAYNEFKQFRGSDGIKTGEIIIGDKTLKLGVVSGLANAKKLINKIRSGEEHFDLIEVMACPGGCVNGAGQPGPYDRSINEQRAKGLFDNDKMLQFHISSENPSLQKVYAENLDAHKIHELLHTTYENRKRIEHEDLVLLGSETAGEKKLSLSICFGTSCFLRGAQDLYSGLMAYIREKGLVEETEFKATFCGKLCKKGPILSVNGKVIEKCSFEKAVATIESAWNRRL